MPPCGETSSPLLPCSIIMRTRVLFSILHARMQVGKNRSEEWHPGEVDIAYRATHGVFVTWRISMLSKIESIPFLINSQGRHYIFVFTHCLFALLDHLLREFS